MLSLITCEERRVPKGLSHGRLEYRPNKTRQTDLCKLRSRRFFGSKRVRLFAPQQRFLPVGRKVCELLPLNQHAWHSMSPREDGNSRSIQSLARVTIRCLLC